MLSETLTLAESTADELVFTKQFADAQSGTSYGVAGQVEDEAALLVVKQQKDRKGFKRTLVSLDTNQPVPDTTSGAYVTRRLYLNGVSPSFSTLAEFLSDCARMAALLGNTSEMTKIWSGQR